MWKSKKERNPIIVNQEEWCESEYKALCKLFGLDPEKTKSFVLRENCSIEYELD